MQKSRLLFQKFGFIALLLIFLILANCSKNSVSEDVPPTPVEPETISPNPTATSIVINTPDITAQPFSTIAVDLDKLNGMSIYLAHPWIGEEAELMEIIAREFSQSNPWGIQILALPHGGETALVDSLILMQEKGKLPEVIAAPDNLRSELVGNHLLVDLNAYFNDMEWGFSSEEREDVFPVFLEPCDGSDPVFSLPFAPQATVLFYNRSWANDLGFFESPHNLEEFKKQNCDATFTNWQDENKQGGTGGWVINLHPRVLASWYYAFGGQIPKDEIPLFNNQAGNETFSYLWEVKNLGCIWFALQPDHQAYFANRFALMYAGYLDQIPVQIGWMDTLSNEDEWEVLGFPGPDGEKILIDGPSLMITTGAPEEEVAAWLFAKFLLEPTVQAKLVEGLFTLPVRRSAMELLTDFQKDFPQWAQGAALIESASIIPDSVTWGIAQWALQDAANRILQDESGDITKILEQLDELILDIVDNSQ